MTNPALNAPITAPSFHSPNTLPTPSPSGASNTPDHPALAPLNRLLTAWHQFCGAHALSPVQREQFYFKDWPDWGDEINLVMEAGLLMEAGAESDSTPPRQLMLSLSQTNALDLIERFSQQHADALDEASQQQLLSLMQELALLYDATAPWLPPRLLVGPSAPFSCRKFPVASFRFKTQAGTLSLHLLTEEIT